MTTLEKLFVQIFERRDWIIEQVQQQADAYSQQLASRFLIDGITPPPWLLNPNFDSTYSDPNELKKEEIISKLLHRPPRDSVPYSGGACPLYCKPVVTGNNGQLSNEICLETRTSNKGLNVSNEPTIPGCRDNDVGCSLNCVTEQDGSVNSPQDETDAKISDIYAAPDKSVARIQRSKSRQKARQQRTNVNVANKSCLSQENRTHTSFSGNSTSKNDFHQVSQNKCASELAKGNDISGANYIETEGEGDEQICRPDYSIRHTRSSTSYEKPSIQNEFLEVSRSSEKEESDGWAIVQPTDKSLRKSDRVNGLMEVIDLPDVPFGGHTARESMQGTACDTQRESKIYCGRITRSRSSIQQTSGINTNSKPCTSSYNPKEGSDALSHSVGSLMHRLDASLMLMDAVVPSGDLRDKIKDTQAICTNEGSLKPANSSNAAACRVTRSRSGAMKEPSLVKSLSDHKGNASQNTLGGQQIPCFPNVDANKDGRNGPIDASVAAHPMTNLDHVTLAMESDGSVLKQSSDRCMVVKPKQLNFDGMEESDLNEICSQPSRKRKLGRLSGQKHSSSGESAASVDHKSSSSFFEQPSPLGNDMSSKPTAKTNPLDNVNECVEDEITNIEADANVYPMVENVEYNSKAAVQEKNSVSCEVNIFPTEVPKSCDEEKNPGKCHLINDYESPIKMQIEEGDIGYKIGENAAAVYVPEAKHSKSSCTSHLAKQGNVDSQDCLDEEVRLPEPIEMLGEELVSSKSKEFGVENNLSLSNMNFNSAKINTWPQNQRRKVEDQPNCFSTSQGCRIHLHQDTQNYTITCDLGEVGNDIDSVSKSELVLPSEERYVSQSDGKLSSDVVVHRETMGNLSAEKSEAVVSEKDDDTAETPCTLKQSEPTCVVNLAKNMAGESTYDLVTDLETADLTSNDVDSRSWYHELDYQSFLDHDVAVSTVVTDNRNFEGNLPGRESHLGRDGLFSYSSVGSLEKNDKTVVGSDDIMPEVEGFIINEQAEIAGLRNAEGGIDFDSLELPSTIIERASILEKICKSASNQTPFSQFSSTFKQHQIQDFSQFAPGGLLEHMDLRNTTSLDEDSSKRLQASSSSISEADSAFPVLPKSDWLPFSATPFDWHSKKHYSSPVGKLWERSSSSSGSSEKRLSSNPELTCFPIEEDPNSNEESECAEEVGVEFQDIMSGVANDLVEREPPVESTEVHLQHACTVVTETKIPERENEEVADEIQEGIVSSVSNDPAERELPPQPTELCFHYADPVSIAKEYPDRSSLNSVNTEVSFPGTHHKVKHKPKNHPSTKTSRYERKEKHNSSIATRASSRGNVSLHAEFSKSTSNMRCGIPRLSQKETKRNNIVSNITSFIPIVQQKQAAAAGPGKRDIKVKALEAAEAAKRREQEKENERKMKKEAMKLERARIEKENVREMELKRKKQQEDQKKREADIAARKRQREEDERKEMMKKRKLAAETRKEQKLQNEKPRTGKVEKEKPRGKNDEIASNTKKAHSASKNLRQNRLARENDLEKHDVKLRTDGMLASDVDQLTSVLEVHDASNDFGEQEKAITMSEKSPVMVELAKSTNQEKSYDISPYQCSDDEDEEEDEIPTKKFVPCWASKTNVALVLPLQQKLNPETIFSPESFCSMDEVLLPRRPQAN